MWKSVQCSLIVVVREVFNIEEKKARRIGEVSSVVGVKLFDRAQSYLAKMKNIALIDTQAIRAKLILQLQGIFELAVSIAKGKVKWLRAEDANEYTLTPKQRE
jgi:hypothetical protein